MLNRRRFVFAAAAMPIAGPAIAAQGDAPIKLRELYDDDRGFSALALSLEGKRITTQGFMAPPLKADARFFVLTKLPMAVCPFCDSEADWPSDIVAVYTKRRLEVIPFNVRIESRGVLELGGFRDPETGFLSRVRLTDATYG